MLRPIFAILLGLLLAVGGLLGYGALAKEANPDLEIAVAMVRTSWPGADPETMEQQVTQAIEDELKAVETIAKLDSASYSGLSVVRVEFTTAADVTESIQRLREAIALAESHFPEGVEAPLLNQHSISDAPILMLALTGDGPPELLSQTAEQLQQRLEALAGVNRVVLGGDRSEVIQIQLDPLRLAQLGISPQTVAQTIRQANQDVPLDELESEAMGGQLRLYGRFRELADLRSLPISRLGEMPRNPPGAASSGINAGGNGGRTVLLGELAQVRRELKQADSLAFVSRGGGSLSTCGYPGSHADARPGFPQGDRSPAGGIGPR